MRYLLRRLGLSVIVMFGVSLIVFVFSHVLPTDPVVLMLGDHASADPATVAAYKAKWGLDKSLANQYWTYMGGLFHGDLGTSILTGRSVTEDLLRYIPATVELATVAIVIGLCVAVPLGAWAAYRPGSKIDFSIRLFSVTGASMPIFWLALILLYVLSLKFHWFPGPVGRLGLLDEPPAKVTGWYTIDSLLGGNFGTFIDACWHLLLPAAVLATWTIGLLSRMVRSSVMATLSEDFVTVARSRGSREFRVLWRHVLPNSTLSVVPVVGLAYADLLAGAVVVEQIFAWPGIGAYGYQAAANDDFAAIVGVSIVAALAYVVVNLIADLYIVFRDPRLRFAAAS